MTTTLAHDVGDVLYIIPYGKMNVIPVRVIEVVTCRNAEGENVRYVVEDELGKTSNLSQDWQVFRTVGALKESMMQKAQNSIDRMISGVEMKTSAWLNDADVAQDNLSVLPDNDVVVDLGDGRVGRLKDSA